MELYGTCWRGNSILLIAIHIHNRNSGLLHRFNAWQNLDKRFLSFSLLTVISDGKEKAMDPKGNQTQGSAPRLYEEQVWK